MSYADAAAKGPKQSPEEVHPTSPPLPDNLLTFQTGVSTPSHHYQTKSPYPFREAKPKDSHHIFHSRAPKVPSLDPSDSNSGSLIDVDSDKVQSVSSSFQDQAVKTRTQAERMEHEAEDSARSKVDSAAKKTGVKEKSAGEKAQDKFTSLKENSDNPVVMGNALLIGIGSAALGFGAYQKYSEGKLDWPLVGTVAGAVGAVAVGDYFLSS
ncbi:MAG: hypothetical protein Q9227_001485 [Pyrenula ochraceoflavens]